MRTRIHVTGLVVAMSVAAAARADGTAPAAPESALESAIRSFDLSGEVEILSTWDPRHSRARGDLDLRGSDADTDRVSIQNIEFLADRPVNDDRAWGARLRVCGGEVSRFVNIDPDADPGASADVREAYVSWRVPGAPLAKTELSAGKFRSPLGFESFENSENFVVTRNPVSCFATPATLVGVRAALPWNEKLTTNVWVTNGWDDRTISDEGRTGIVHAVLGRFDDPLSSQIQVSASYGSLTGPGVPKGDKRRFFEVIWDGRLTEGLDFTVDAVSGHSPDRTWNGVAGYLKHPLTSDITVAARVGTYDDDALAPGGARVSDLSLVLSIRPTETLMLSMELRHDRSADDVFRDADGDPSGEQDTLTFSVVYRF